MTKPSLESLLENVVDGRALFKLRKGAKLFSQGEEADALYLVQAGKVQISVVSPQDKKVTLATMGPHDFFGEECLVGNSHRGTTATSIGPSTVLEISKHSMLKALQGESRLSEAFIASLLAHNVNLEEALRDQLFNHSERRLASLLLKLSRFGHRKQPDVAALKYTHKMLAEAVGATRQQIRYLLKKFKARRLVDYDKESAGILVMVEALTDSLLGDEFNATDKTKARRAH